MEALFVVMFIEIALLILHILGINIPILTINKTTYENLKNDKPLIRKYHSRSAAFMAAGLIVTLACMYCYYIGFVEGMIIGWFAMIVSVVVYSVRINAG